MSRPRYVWECTCGEKSEVIHNGVQAQKAAARHEDSNALDMRDHTAEVRRIIATTCDEAPRLTSLATATSGGSVTVVSDDCNDCGEPGKGTMKNGICSSCRWEARHLQAGLRGDQ